MKKTAILYQGKIYQLASDTNHLQVVDEVKRLASQGQYTFRARIGFVLSGGKLSRI